MDFNELKEKYTKLYKENKAFRFVIGAIVVILVVIGVRLLFTVTGDCGQIANGEKDIVDTRILFICDFPNNITGNPNPYY